MNAIDLARQAYGASASPVRTDRGTEYEIFARTTRKLIQATQEGAPFSQLAEALHENRQLWMLISTVVADGDNKLPERLRAQLFYLSEFTAEHTRKVLRREAAAAPLIDINRLVMQGLKPSEAQA